MLTDKEIMECALTALKHSAHLYHGLSEHTGSAYLLREVSQLLNAKQEMRLAVFQAMNERGWYNPRLIAPDQLQQHVHMAAQELQGLRQRFQGAAPAWNPAPPQPAGFTAPGFAPGRPAPETAGSHFAP